jgi:hypothetical protein
VASLFARVHDVLMHLGSGTRTYSGAHGEHEGAKCKELVIYDDQNVKS